MKFAGYCEERSDSQKLQRGVADAAAQFEDFFETQCLFFASMESFRDALKRLSNLDLCCIDVARPGTLCLAKDARALYSEALMLLIVDPEMLPTQYIRPDIMPSSLLLRPFTAEQVDRSFCELFLLLKARLRMLLTADDSFVIELKQGKELFRHREILCFEAREKKIFLNTNKVSVPFYGTLDALTKELPSQYVRCHKSFIVNTQHILRIQYADNMVTLTDGSQVPISRSYRTEMKELKL